MLKSWFTFHVGVVRTANALVHRPAAHTIIFRCVMSFSRVACRYVLIPILISFVIYIIVTLRRLGLFATVQPYREDRCSLFSHPDLVGAEDAQELDGFVWKTAQLH